MLFRSRTAQNSKLDNAVRDAEKISDYVAEHYLNAEHTAELDAENTNEDLPVFDAEAVFSEQVDAVLSGADTTSTHVKFQIRRKYCATSVYRIYRF